MPFSLALSSDYREGIKFRPTENAVKTMPPIRIAEVCVSHAPILQLTDSYGENTGNRR